MPDHPDENEIGYLHANSTVDEMRARLIELYSAGAVIEYHQFHPSRPVERCHVGFRYGAMSDDDYFESDELETRLGVKENANWRGDTALLKDAVVEAKTSISGEDYEFYYSPLVLHMAYALSGKSGEEFSALSDKTRFKWLDRAKAETTRMFNNETVQHSVKALARNLEGRKR